MNVNTLSRQIEQPVCLDHFQPLVHHGRRIDSDLAAHVPVRVSQRILQGDILERRDVTITERATRGGQDQPLDIPVAVTFERLKYGRMFAIHRVELHSVFCHRLHDQGAGCHQGFLVGQGDILARFDCGHGRHQAGGSDNRRHRHFNILMAGAGDQAFDAGENVRGIAAEGSPQAFGVSGIDNRNDFRPEGADLLLEQLKIITRRHGDDPTGPGLAWFRYFHKGKTLGSPGSFV